MPKIINIIGQKFGLLTVLSFAKVTPAGHKSYNCLCDCGNNVVRTGTSITRSKNSSCGCFYICGKHHRLWEGVGEISKDFWFSHIIRSANGSKLNNQTRKPKELTITIEDAWGLFIKQERRCALSNLELTFPKNSNDKTWTASLDRIDSSEGYINGNVQWVHKYINIMKNKYDNEYFITMCKLVANNCK